MLRRSLRTISATRLAPASRYTQYKRGGEGLGVVDPDPRPVGTYYKYIYAEGAIPELKGRYQGAYPNEYTIRPMYEADNFQFDYWGQWWDIGYKWIHISFMLLPVLLAFAKIYELVRKIFFNFQAK